MYVNNNKIATETPPPPPAQREARGGGASCVPSPLDSLVSRAHENSRKELFRICFRFIRRPTEKALLELYSGHENKTRHYEVLILYRNPMRKLNPLFQVSIVLSNLIVRPVAGNDAAPLPHRDVCGFPVALVLASDEQDNDEGS